MKFAFPGQRRLRVAVPVSATAEKSSDMKVYESYAFEYSDCMRAVLALGMCSRHSSRKRVKQSKKT